MTMTTSTEKATSMMKLFDAARRAGVPLLAITTADQSATIEQIRKAFDEFPMMQWDAARGITGANAAGTKALQKIGLKASETYGFLEAMVAAENLPEASILFVRNAERQLHSSEARETAGSVAALAALRDIYKLNFRTVVLLSHIFTAPAEMEHDIITIQHGLPTRTELGVLALELFDVVSLPKPKGPALEKIIDAVTGLSLFEAEQIISMSFTDSGIDMDALWDRKRAAIDAKPGLSVVRGKTTFADISGLASLKSRLHSHKGAKTPVGVVVWIDEGADVFSAVDTGTNDQKMDQQRGLLVWMEEHKARGVILVGVPGTGKSLTASAMGNECGVLSISADFGAMENKFVGESEARFRSALDTIDRVGDGHAFFILTCNSLKGIRPQFQARFRRGIFFVDLPDTKDCDALWSFYMKKFDIKKQPMPDYAGWTGREIAECCESAWDTGTTLLEASKFIIPVSRSRATEIEEMRREAHGRFLDASKDGEFEYKAEPMAKQVRAIALPGAKEK
jgi:hypothetical protein